MTDQEQSDLRLTAVPPPPPARSGSTNLADLYPDDDRWKVQTIRGTGAVYLVGPELELVDAPEFQRLQGIKQLGTTYFVFRGAVHTRFEHSLGTLQKAEQIIQAVNRGSKGVKVDRTGHRVARLAALLHDLPHVPFGHTLEDEFGLLTRHDENQPRLTALLEDGRIGDVLRDSLDEKERLMLFSVLGLQGKGSGGAPPRGLDKEQALARRLGDHGYCRQHGLR